MNRKFIALVMSTMLISSVAPYTMSAFAENTTTAISTETELDLILPQTTPEYIEFIEKYGNVSVHGKYIVYCDSVNFSTGAEVVTEQEGTAEIKEVKNYSISDGEIKPPGSSADMVYVYEAVSAGTVKFTISQGMPLYWEQSKNVKDSGYYKVSENLEIEKITEKDFTETVEHDEFDWLPQTMPEYIKFIEKYGNVSVHGKYIVYCDSVNFSTGAEVVTEQEGTAEIKEVKKYSISDGEIKPPGSSADMVYVYEAVSAGTIKFTISQGMPLYWEQSKDIKNIGYYKVSENLEIEKITEKDFIETGEHDEFDWLPQTMPEYQEFIEKYGKISVHGKYIVYCDKVNYSCNEDVAVQQSGNGQIKEVRSYSVSENIDIDGYASDMVYVYEAMAKGNVRVDILQLHPLSSEEKQVVVDTGYYAIADDLTITRTEADIEKGDANGDGELNIADLVMLNNWLLGKGELTCWQNVDLCKDGKIDVFDMIILKKEIMSKNK